MALSARELGSNTLRSVGGMREVVQDLVTPDLKAVKGSVEALTQELRLRTETLSQEMKFRYESLHEELRLRTEKLEAEIKLRTENLQEEMRLRDSIQSAKFDKLTEAVTELAREISALNLDLRERVAILEARVPRQ